MTDQRRPFFDEPDEKTWERSRQRWIWGQPAPQLTWGKRIKGDAFIAKAKAHGAFGHDKSILEIGPGYGRLLMACFDLEIPFARYVGVDIAPANVEYLSKTFIDPRVHFIHGDIETIDLPGKFDAVLSSLTLKHLYPTFEKAMVNLARQLNPGAVVVFDLIEGEKAYFEQDAATYLRWYSKDEVRGILSSAGLDLKAFEVVQHDPEYSRLLVVARR
ncbi:MAG TPA: class I SAM-dependent methyltransferase [Thermoanaerobaculia bacterium]